MLGRVRPDLLLGLWHPGTAAGNAESPAWAQAHHPTAAPGGPSLPVLPLSELHVSFLSVESDTYTVQTLGVLFSTSDRW